MDADSGPARAAPAPEPSDPITDKVNAWFVEFIHNSPISQSTVAVNYLRSVLPQLVAKIKE